MGEDVARALGMQPRVVHVPAGANTSSADTHATAAAMQAQLVDLLLFAGGDGTARDILAAVGTGLPTLGIPAGVKMHSAVFASSARTAGEVARNYLARAGVPGGDRLREAEVLDREAHGSPQLYGSLLIPHAPLLVPRAKAAASASDDGALAAAIAQVAQMCHDDRITLIGPGSTMQQLKRQLGDPGVLLGVAIFRGGQCLLADASEQQILDHVKQGRSRIVTSVVGGQGFLFGRGNQQLSARVIRAVGRENIVVVASLAKVVTLPANALLVDTGDPALDADLAGHLPVVVGSARTMIVAVKDAAQLMSGDAR